MRACPFCSIASEETPSSIVYENELIVSFLDLHPIRPGHAQIIPREHFDYFEALPPATASKIIHFGQELARIMKEQFGVERVAFLFTGGDISHAHAHLVPMHESADITSRGSISRRKT